MKEYIVTLTVLIAIQARNEEQAEKRAEELQDFIGFKPTAGWAKKLEVESIESAVEEV